MSDRGAQRRQGVVNRLGIRKKCRRASIVAVRLNDWKMIEKAVHLSPVRLVAIIALSIFLCEALVMFIFLHLAPMSSLAEAFFDSALLVLLLSPMLFFFLFRPLMLHISERENAEESLRESEEKYRTLFEQSMDAIYITTRDGKFMDVNQSALELFDCTRKEMMRLNAVSFYVNPDDRREFQREIEKKGFVKDYELKLRKKDGAEIHCLISSTARKSSDGTYSGYQGIIRDVTKKKRAEKELAQRIEELEKFHQITMGRELKMMELKEKIKDLKKKLAENRIGGARREGWSPRS